jgi:Protein of unknown function (DUF2970)
VLASADFAVPVPAIILMTDPATRHEGAAPAPPVGRRASLLEVVGAVFGSFLGIRRGKAMRRDEIAIRPGQVIVVGIILAAMLVTGLLFLVRFIIRAAAG